MPCFDELKALPPLSDREQKAKPEGCYPIHHFNDLPPARRLVYRCIDSMLNVEDVANDRGPMVLLYGADTVRQAEVLPDHSERSSG